MFDLWCKLASSSCASTAADIELLTRAMTRDTATYPRPEDFLPERFQSGPENEEPPEDPRGIVFGFGRRCVAFRITHHAGLSSKLVFCCRICPGRHLVDNSLWLAIVTITATLSISRAVDADGKEIMPVLAFPSSAVRCVTSYKSGIALVLNAIDCRHYEDFQCVIRPRSQAIVDIVMQMDSEQV